MKKPWLAYLLNFIFPGLGFVYLRQWMWAGIDLLATLAVAAALYALAPRLGDQAMRLAPVIISVVNGSIASAAARSLNQKCQPAAAPTAAP